MIRSESFKNNLLVMEHDTSNILGLWNYSDYYRKKRHMTCPLCNKYLYDSHKYDTTFHPYPCTNIISIFFDKEAYYSTAYYCLICEIIFTTNYVRYEDSLNNKETYCAYLIS